MSSKLIGELGMVGLTIPKKRSASERPSMTDEDASPDEVAIDSAPSDFAVEKDPLESSPSDQPRPEHDNAVSLPELRKRRAGSGVKKFRAAWMTYDIFKNWLQPHADPELAECSVCNRVIKAGKSELEKHATARRHVEMMKKNAANFDVSPSVAEVLASNGAGEPSIIINCEDSLPVSSQKPNESGGTAYYDDQYATGVMAFPSVTLQQKARPILPHEVTTVTSNRATVLKAAPHWKATAVVNGHVTKLDLHDYKGRYLVLVFYPQDFARLCASELNRLSDRIEEFRDLNADIVACSTDSHLSHLAWLKQPRLDNGVACLKIPLLADPTQAICKDYGVYLSDRGHALRAHFIIDGRGILRHATVNDPLIGRGTHEMLRIIRALQYADDAGAPVTVDWTPLN